MDLIQVIPMEAVITGMMEMAVEAMTGAVADPVKEITLAIPMETPVESLSHRRPHKLNNIEL
jgi:hypothetical protein